MKYVHTNIIADDWRLLAQFYQDVFDCVPVPPERDLKGEWLNKGTGLKDAHLFGIHLRLPGYGEEGPTLEIYGYKNMVDKPVPVANRKGYGHIAFQVNDVEEVVEKVLAAGGTKVGEVCRHEVPEVGMLTFIYMADPEENIVEIQRWGD